ncbi:MAG: energy transducer TonB [Vicinamibacterales bacterium]
MHQSVLRALPVGLCLLAGASTGLSAQTRLTDEARRALLATVVPVRAAVMKSMQRSVVCGSVSRARAASEGVDAVLDLVDPVQRDVHLMVVIPEGSRQRFSPLFVRQMVDREACFDGRVEPMLGVMGMRINDPIQLKFVGAPPGQTREFATGAVTLDEPGITPPVVIAAPPPDYSRRAMESLLQGDVEVELRVGPDGVPQNARITRSLDPAFGLDDEAVKSAMRWRFKPAMRGDLPVTSLVTVNVSFRFPGVIRMPRGGAIIQRSGREAVAVASVSGEADDAFFAGAARPATGQLPALRDAPGPWYPVAALALGQEGEVELDAVVMPDGTVDRVRIVTPFPNDAVGVGEHAARAVLTWRFAPAPAGTGPRAVRATVRFGFRTPDDARREVGGGS